MKQILVWATVILLMVLGTGCGGGTDTKKADPGKSGGELIRGMSRFGHEVRELVPCGGQEPLWVSDRTGVLKSVYEMLVPGKTGDTPIFVAALGDSGPPPSDGFGAEYAGAVAIREVIYAGLEGFRCDFDFSGFRYRAHGNEPFWMVEVLQDGMRLVRPGSPEVLWTEVTVEQGENQVVLRGLGTADEGVLTLTPGPAFDSMSGAYFHLKARFDFGGQAFWGTGLKGAPGPHD